MHGQSPEGNISQSCAESQFQGQRLSQLPQSNAGAAQQGNQPLIFDSPLQARHLSQGNPMQMQSYPHFQPLPSAQQGGIPPVSSQGINPQLFAPQPILGVNPQSAQQGMQGVYPQLFAPLSMQGINPQFAPQFIHGVNSQLAVQPMTGVNLQPVLQPVQLQGVLTPSIPQSIQQPTQTPTHPLNNDHDEEEKLNCYVDTALCISRGKQSVKECAHQHGKPKGPPVKERKKTNRLSQEVRSRFESVPIIMCVQSPHIKPRLAEHVMKQCSCDTKVKPLTYVLEMTPEKSTN